MIVAIHAREVGTDGRRYLGRNHARWVFHLAVDLEERGKALWILSVMADGATEIDVQIGARPTADEHGQAQADAWDWLTGGPLPVDEELAIWGGL